MPTFRALSLAFLGGAAMAGLLGPFALAVALDLTTPCPRCWTADGTAMLTEARK
ncbi:hypothetical protein [Frigidibacter sp. MR17.24]|uniref:hypothetical protein n=1 Tax=Frigidibacter sp. MR17.24 TaxID=3127345 RepID=UPI0030130466